MRVPEFSVLGGMSSRIRLANGRYAVVDTEDAERLRGYKWSVHSDGRQRYLTVSNARVGRLGYFILGIKLIPGMRLEARID